MKIRFICEEAVAVGLSSPVTVADAARMTDLMINIPCGGGGRCGKCKVRVMGEVSPPTETERALLSPSELASGVRLACQAVVTGDADVYLDASKIKVETSVGEVTASPNTYALDIGTTTLALRYTDENGCVHTSAAANPQCAFGADVMSRISYASEHGGRALTDAVRHAVARLKADAGVPDTARGVAVGNTVMLSLYAGVDVTSIGVYPYQPADRFGRETGGEYLPLCPSGFIGADALASALASGMDEYERAIVCDIGTNGEIIYKNGGEYTAASAAAGPALEGAGISSGMRAETGAVDGACIRDGKIALHIIGEGEPRGICGGGLIDAVACFIELGAVDETGYMESPCDLGGVTLTPSDIRAFQLAKGALRAAVELLTDGADVDRVFISGGFGSGIDVDSAIKTGLLPERFRGKVTFIGNGALSGASILSRADARESYLRLTERLTPIDLMPHPDFTEKYMEYIGF